MTFWIGSKQWNDKRYREGKHKVESWEKMKRLLKAKFLPVTYKQDAYLDYHNLKQGSLPVEELIREFERMRMRCGADEDKEQVIARFLSILRRDIANVFPTTSRPPTSAPRVDPINTEPPVIPTTQTGTLNAL
ncbi:reverse transcriptase domain-containing protein [Tanacetum coccineum]